MDIGKAKKIALLLNEAEQIQNTIDILGGSDLCQIGIRYTPTGMVFKKDGVLPSFDFIINSQELTKLFYRTIKKRLEEINSEIESL